MNKTGWVADEISELKASGRYVPIRVLQSAQGSWVTIDGARKLNMCSNNYLGLANNPETVKSAIDSLRNYGVGAGAVRSIAGTEEIHIALEKKIAAFKHMEASVVFQGGLLANTGTIPVLVGKDDIVFSEELNHASIIDGVRLSSAKRVMYRHMDMQDLRNQLKEHRSEGRRALIITDGVFSMDGDIAPLPEIVDLSDEFDAMSYVDDAHGEGVLGDHGRGIVDHFNLSKRIDVEMGTFSKALGAVGGFSAGSYSLADLIKQRSRPFLFSSAMNPADAAAVLKSIEILERDDSLLKKLWDNATYLKKGLGSLGFNTGTSKTPITPVIVGDERKTLELSKQLFENENVFASPIVFPTVPKGTARIRLMPSAVHSRDDLNVAIEAFRKIGKALGLIG